MPATLTKSLRTGTGKTSPVTVKRTKPSKPGTIVDTKQAKLLAQDAAKSAAKVEATIGGAVTKMTGKGPLENMDAEASAEREQLRDEAAAAESIARDDEDRRQAVLEMADTAEAKAKGHIPPKGKAKAAAKKSSTKAKNTGKAKSTSNGSGPAARVTESWTGKGSKEVEVGSVVKAPGIASLTIVGRWTKRKGEQKIPFVTGTTPDGTRKNVAAADCAIVKGPAAKK